MDLTIPDGVPDGVEAFLAEAGWAGATIDPLPGDASFRRYFRIRGGAGDAMLMHAPPPQEDPAPFLRAAKWLDANGLRAPRILAERAERASSCSKTSATCGCANMSSLAAGRGGGLSRRDRRAAQGRHAARRAVPPYGMAEYLRETKLFTDWFCPARGLQVDARGWAAAWEEVLRRCWPGRARA
jgi:aminoglycoside/choline kinase family phosphotransferase